MSVSICICTYNQASYLEKAVRSAAEQKVTPIEIIVSDDCSTDNTAEVLKRLATEISFLTVIRQPVNLGIGKNTDFCLRQAKGDFVLRLDSDDCLMPDYTGKLLDLLTQFPEAGYAHAAVQEIDQFDHFLKERKLFRKSGFQSSDDALKAALKGYRVAANIIIFRREALEKVNFLTARPDFGEDYHLTASISAAGYGNVYLDEILSHYRVWVDTGKVRVRRKLTEIAGLRSVFEDVLEPAFKVRGWPLETIEKNRANFACIHSDCLGWDVYTENEKLELKTELHKLSSSARAQVFAWLYFKGLGGVISFYFKMIFFPRSIAKNMILKWRG
jgi:glycosyltransferase involved in cell wall biosynthesis